MDGSDSGTPNPLNPMSGNDPMPDNSPISNNMPEIPESRPASAMPEMREARPVRPAPRPVNHDIVDPMMRSAARNNAPAPSAPKPEIVAEESFDTLTMDGGDSLETLTQDVIATNTPPKMQTISRADEPNLVAKDSIVEPAGKKSSKKKPLIIGAIILLLVALACAGAAVAMMMLGNKGDQISKAIEKVISGELPTIVTVQGSIETTAEAQDGTAAGNTTIDFNGTFDTTSSMNKVSADVAMNLGNNNNLLLSVEELQNKTGTTYFKVSGLSDLVSNPIMASFSDFSGLLEAADNNWILVSDDFNSSMEDLDLFDNPSTCLINAFSTLPQYSNDIISKYKANPFIESSTNNLDIAKKSGTLYRLSFNSNKLSAFANSLNNNGFVNELNACMDNTASNSGTSATMIEDIFSNFPILYAEVDDNNNFTRFYFKVNSSDENVSSTTTADITLTYPKEFKITEPADYITMSNLLSGVMSSLINNTTDTTNSTTGQ